MGKFLGKLDKWAKKGSGLGGKLGLISKTVDALIPDATSEVAKESKILQDTNTGEGSLTQKTKDTPITSNMKPAVEDEKKRTLSQKWGHLPIWAKGSIIAGLVGIVILIIRKVTHGGKKMMRKY